jgi:hypothetical protein
MTDDTYLSRIEARQAILENHPVFGSIQNIGNLRLFMSWHVFAVWDFMCLVKRLQRELTSMELPWLPSAAPVATRMINEIVLAEESDETPDGISMSHFELYLLSMKDMGADTAQIEEFIAWLRTGKPVNRALEMVSANSNIQDFVNNTMNTAVNGNVYQVLGSFFFGREHVIPKMFTALLEDWHIEESEAPMFVYYLRRHIELDGDDHGPAAGKLINQLTQDNPEAIRDLHIAALKAINDRIRLWDGLHQLMSAGMPACSSTAG